MIRARQCAALAFAVCVFSGCRPHKQDATDAGTEGGEDAAAAGTSSQPSASTVPPPLATAEQSHKHIGARCAAGEVAILLPPEDETCVVECKSSAACPPGWGCDGEGVLSHAGKPGGAITYCRVASHGKATDAGTAPGAATSLDAGAAPHVDAGPPAKKLDVKQVGGHCPAGYGSCGAACRLTCSKEVDCGAASVHCLAGLCVGPNAQACGK
jgi:hypothetical protein